MGNFLLFQQTRHKVTVKYTNCNLLEYEWIRIGIRTLEAQIDEKNNIEAWQNFTGSYKKKECFNLNVAAVSCTAFPVLSKNV